jgi:hypothetical protein
MACDAMRCACLDVLFDLEGHVRQAPAIFACALGRFW